MLGPKQFSQTSTLASDSSPGCDGIPYSGLVYQKGVHGIFPLLLHKKRTFRASEHLPFANPTSLSHRERCVFWGWGRLKTESDVSSRTINMVCRIFCTHFRWCVYYIQCQYIKSFVRVFVCRISSHFMAYSFFLSQRVTFRLRCHLRFPIQVPFYSKFTCLNIYSYHTDIL